MRRHVIAMCSGAALRRGYGEAEAARRAAATQPEERGRRGFTLIEILASMAILVVIIMLVGRMFKDTTNAWSLGTRRSQQNLAARAAMDFIARDVGQAVADSQLSFWHTSEYRSVFGNWESDALFFVSLANESDSEAPRMAREIRYYVDEMLDVRSNNIAGRYRLVRAMKTGAVTCYATNQWWTHPAAGFRDTVIDNIGSFEVWCYGSDDATNGAAFVNVPSYNSTAPASAPLAVYERHKVPAWAEIYVSVMDEDTSIRAKTFLDANRAADAREFVDRNARRYVIRVNFANRQGYTGDR